MPRLSTHMPPALAWSFFSAKHPLTFGLPLLVVHPRRVAGVQVKQKNANMHSLRCDMRIKVGNKFATDSELRAALIVCTGGQNKTNIGMQAP